MTVRPVTTPGKPGDHLDRLPATVSVSRAHLEHRLGTKDYDISVVAIKDSAPHGRALLITRWGAIGKSGQHQVERLTFHEAEKQAHLKQTQKIKKGYGATARGYAGHRQPDHAEEPHSTALDPVRRG